MAHRLLTASSQPWLHNGITRRTSETTDHWGLNSTELNQEYELDMRIFTRPWVVFMYRKVWEQSSGTIGPSHHYDLPLCSSLDSLQPYWAFFDHSKYIHTRVRPPGMHGSLPSEPSSNTLFQSHHICENFWSPQVTEQCHFSPWLIFFHYTINTWNTHISSYSLLLYLSIFH